MQIYLLKCKILLLSISCLLVNEIELNYIIQNKPQ